jgi:peptidoglycan/LPS O-acetylase OafA/YrhL
MMRRLLRIWPGFVAASLVMLLIIVPLGTDSRSKYLENLHSAPVVAGHLARAVFLNQPASAFGFETNPISHVIDGSLWTIKYEFAWYCIVAIFGLCGVVAKRKPMLLLSISTVALSVIDDTCGGRFGAIQFGGIRLDNVISCGAPFTMGMLALAYKDSIPRHPLLLAAALASFILAHFFPRLIVLVVPLSFVYALFWFCFSSNSMLAPIGAKNDFSYGFYLYAYGVQQMLVYRLHWLTNPLLLFVLATALTAPFALFSWFCIERPAKMVGSRR